MATSTLSTEQYISHLHSFDIVSEEDRANKIAYLVEGLDEVTANETLVHLNEQSDMTISTLYRVAYTNMVSKPLFKRNIH